jgi:hypothetical protein
MLRREFIAGLAAAALSPHAAHAQQAMPAIGAIGHEIPANLVLRTDTVIE